MRSNPTARDEASIPTSDILPLPVRRDRAGVRARDASIGSARRRRGATLVEMLIGLSITAALLTATAVAMDASLKSYQVNQEQASLLQRARTSVHRLLSAVRAGDAHQPYSEDAQSDFADGWDVDDSGIRLEAADGAE